jgi:CRISPR-associated protein Csm3
MSLKLIKYARISGTLTCKTGLRIGGSKEEMEIGGMENPIIRHPLTKHPYIPGSSLKGKLRSLLEYKTGKYESDGKPCGCAMEDCLVCRIFGPHLVGPRKFEYKWGPSRIIVRDAAIKKESLKELEILREKEGLLYAEIKTENIIDRRTGVAADKGLRSQERVPAGTQFDLNISVRIFEGDDEEKILGFIKQGLDMLPDDTLGGSGTRGYGWVEVNYPVGA